MTIAHVGALLLIAVGVVLGAVAIGLIGGAPAVLGFLGSVAVLAGCWLGYVASRTSDVITEEEVN